MRKAMASTAPSAFLFGFILSASLIALPHLCCCNGEAEMTESHLLHHDVDGHFIIITSLTPTSTNCSTSISNQDTSSQITTLKLVHRHNPCLQPSHSRGAENIKSPQQSLKQILLHDKIRVDSLQNRLSKKKVNQLERKKTTLPARSGLSLGSGNYIVRVGFGTPKEDLSLIFDTGSDFTWIQCDPCSRSCYDQQDPIFKPSSSKSYSNISCNSNACSHLRSATSTDPKCSSSTCVYGIQYGDQSYSVGYFASETITLNTDAFPNFLFGCGQNNRGLFGNAAGLLGLGRDQLSLVSQTAKKYGKVFSYCLPSTPSATGFLSFGNYQGASPNSVKYTPLLTDSKYPSFYFLDLIGISVGGTKLAISASVFASGGTIIDSGTVITRLPPTAYSALRTAFRKLMTKYPLGNPISILDTCYDFSGLGTVTVPKIALFFRPGIQVDLDVSGILLAATRTQSCLPFAANGNDGDVTILGNMQQQKLDVIYDLPKSRIGFGPGRCS